MPKPVPMAKVTLVGPKTQLGATIEALHDLRILHIQDYTPGEEGFDLGSPLAQGAQVSEKLLKLRGVLKNAHLGEPAAAKRYTVENLRQLEEKLVEVERELSHLVEKRNHLVDERNGVQEQEHTLQRIRSFPYRLESIQGFTTLTTALGFVPAGARVETLRSVDPNLEYATSPEAEGTLLFVAAPKAADKALQDALTPLGFAPLELPRLDGTPAKRLEALASERSGLEAKVAEIDGKVATLRDKYGDALLAWDEFLAIEADKATAPVRFRTTKNAFMIEGWIPRSELKRLQTRMDDRTQGKVFVTEVPTPLTTPWKYAKAGGHGAHHHEAGHGPAEADPPVALAAPARADAYKLLTDTYSRPKYTEFDPTLFFFIGYPLFYGIMLGDIGYGLVLLFLVWFGVFDKVLKFLGFNSRVQINRILAHCAFSSILFGALYTEFFGLELLGHAGILSHYETHLGVIPYPLARFANVKLLLFLTLIIAAVHMMIGLVVGVRNAAVDHGFGQALKHRGSWIFVLLAASLVGATLLPPILGLGVLVPPPADTVLNFVALGFLVLGSILLVMGEGPTALLELPTILSNMLSYTRLVAIGLSGAGIALAGNEVAKLVLGDGGVVGWIAMGIVLLFFHGLNLVLGVLGPALHSLRLHYVEFFTKFYQGGGDPYQPFGAQRQYTTKEVKQA